MKQQKRKDNHFFLIFYYFADCREDAEKRFQEISRAYESLMTTDEDIKIEQLANF
jgi:hypothetical protein